VYLGCGEEAGSAPSIQPLIQQPLDCLVKLPQKGAVICHAKVVEIPATLVKAACRA
jgi:hypothetical protein